MTERTVLIEFTTEADDQAHATRIFTDMLRTASIEDDDETDWRVREERYQGWTNR